MSTRGFTPPDEFLDPAGPGDDEGEPDTKDDEFARDDAPEQDSENDV